MEDCLFCKIVQKEIPCHKIYEDDNCLAFLDINPVSEGHTLVITKKHYSNLMDIPEKELENLILVVKKVSELLKAKLNKTGINIINSSGKSAEQEIFHIHFHIVPRENNDDLKLWQKTKSKDFNLENIKKRIIE
jgi:histidine triad (HIT) family protein